MQETDWEHTQYNNDYSKILESAKKIQANTKDCKIYYELLLEKYNVKGMFNLISKHIGESRILDAMLVRESVILAFEIRPIDTDGIRGNETKDFQGDDKDNKLISDLNSMMVSNLQQHHFTSLCEILKSYYEEESLIDFSYSFGLFLKMWAKWGNISFDEESEKRIMEIERIYERVMRNDKRIKANYVKNYFIL